MFGKILRTRSAASPAPQFHTGPNAQTAPKNPKSLVKKFLHVKNVFKRSSAAKKDAGSEGSPHHRQGVPASPQPVQGRVTLIPHDQAGHDGRFYFPSPLERAQSPDSFYLSPHAQAWWDGAASSAVAGTTVSTNTPQAAQLASSRLAATTPATTSAHTPSTSQLPTRPTALCSTPLLDAPPRPAPQRSLATPTATASIPAPPSYQRSKDPAATRSNLSPIFPPRSVATAPPTTSSTHSASRRSTPTIAPRTTCSPNPSDLLAPPKSVATTPATGHSPPLASFRSSKPTKALSPSDQLIAELEATAADLKLQYNECVQGVYSKVQNQIFTETISLVDQTKLAKKELEAVLAQIAAADGICAKLQALYQDECIKFEEAGAALKKSQRLFEKADKEHTALQADIHELKLGEALNGVRVKRDPKPLQRGFTPSQPAPVQAKEEQRTTHATLDSPQQTKTVVNIRASHHEPIIALERSSVPRAAPVPPQAPPARVSQRPPTALNGSRRQTKAGAQQADTPDTNGRPLLRDPLARDSLPHTPKNNPRITKHA